VKRLIHLPAMLAILLVKAYQLLVRPVLPRACRFHPSCSEYALEALGAHGLFYGLYLTARRLLRCHPFHPGGLDPVPPVRGA
jgi:hypothetical protein